MNISGMNTLATFADLADVLIDRLHDRNEGLSELEAQERVKAWIVRNHDKIKPFSMHQDILKDELNVKEVTVQMEFYGETIELVF